MVSVAQKLLKRSTYLKLWYQYRAQSDFNGIRVTQLLYPVVSTYSRIWFLWYKRDLVTLSCDQGTARSGFYGIRETQ